MSKETNLLTDTETAITYDTLLATVYHHPFCNYFAAPRIGCKQCESLYKLHPIKEGESLMDGAERIMRESFPDAKKVR